MRVTSNLTRSMFLDVANKVKDLVVKHTELHGMLPDSIKFNDTEVKIIQDFVDAYKPEWADKERTCNLFTNEVGHNWPEYFLCDLKVTIYN